jgi:hypothetical protein
MSLKVMTWAWTLRLPPAPKLVLMALADEADDRGFCFPSVHHLANKCSITERSVQRMIRLLASRRYVSIEPRFRKRARTSNGYQLAVDHPPTNCQGVSDHAATGPATALTGGGRRRCHRPPDGDVGVTTTYPCSYPKPQPPECKHTAAPDQDRCGGDLLFPGALSRGQREALGKQLDSLSQETAQQVLDELAGRMNTTPVRNPIRYCAALVSRLLRGEFQPELGLQIADRRRAQRQREALLCANLTVTGAAVDESIGRLSESIRASLERMRLRSGSAPTHGGSEGSSPDDSLAEKWSE